MNNKKMSAKSQRSNNRPQCVKYFNKQDSNIISNLIKKDQSSKYYFDKENDPFYQQQNVKLSQLYFRFMSRKQNN